MADRRDLAYDRARSMAGDLCRLATTLGIAFVLASCQPEQSSPVAAVESAAPSVEVAPTEIVVMPQPRRKRLDAAVSLNASCEPCHLDEAREWRGSLHRRSATDPAYRKAFALEPAPFCRGCHAPEADPAREPSAAVRDLGVGCVTCHVTEAGAVLSVPSARAVSDDARAAHDVRRSGDFARAGGCAGCHEFRFPVPGVDDDDGLFMQTTVREHARSPARDDGCASCHMPEVSGRRSHAFDQTRDAAWVRAGLDVRAEPSGEHGVRLVLSQPTAGHAFPTGDLFRRLEVGAELRASSGAVVRRDTRHLARHFETTPGKPGRVLAYDDRVHFEPLTIELSLDDGAPLLSSGAIAWWVTLQRVATVGAGRDPRDAKVESEVRLHSGALSWKGR
jgi:hypothetical protein